MKNSAFILSLLLLTTVACAKKNSAKVTKTTTTKEMPVVKNENIADKKTVPNDAITQTDNPNEVKLIAKIKRTPCYGKCPVFTIELFSNGVAHYSGLAFVDKKGKFKTTVTPDFIKQIQSKALEIKYLSLQEKYPTTPSAIADLPTTTTFIRIGNDSKQIIDNYDAPRELIDFENWLEQAFNKLEWRAD